MLLFFLVEQSLNNKLGIPVEGKGRPQNNATILEARCCII